MKTNVHTTLGFLIGTLFFFQFNTFGQNLGESEIRKNAFRISSTKRTYDGAAKNSGFNVNYWFKTNPGEIEPNTGQSYTPPFRDFAMQIGRTDTGAEIDKITVPITVPKDRSNLVIIYFLVMEDPKHSYDDQPKLVWKVKKSGNLVDPVCGSLIVVAGPGIPGFKDGNNGIVYKPWTTVSIDLSAYVGETVELEFIVYDCRQTAHFAFACVDAFFTDEQIQVSFCTPDGDYAHLVAPPGYAEYVWSDGTKGQVLRLHNAPRQSDFTVDMVSRMGCRLTLHANVNLGLSSLMIGKNVTHVSCEGVLDGSIKLDVTGGTPPYNFKWNTGSDKPAIINLAPGIYTASISDKIGCETVETIEVETRGVKIEAPSVGGSVRCAGGSDGGSSVRWSGGKPPYSIFLNGSIYISDTTLFMIQFQGLASGSYDVEVKDSGGCSATTTFTVSGPPALSLSASNIMDASCHGSSDGSISTNLSGGTPPYSVAWNDGASTANRDNLPAGSYSATVMDANGCNATLLVAINQPLPIDFTVTVKDTDCFGASTGNVTISILTPGDFSVVWSTGATGIVLANAPAGVYWAKVYNETHCMVKDVRVEEPEQIHINPQLPMNHGFDISCFGGQLPQYRVRVGGGVRPYDVAFYNQPAKEPAPSRLGKKATTKQFKTDSVLVFSNLSAGQYRLDITDANGCQQTLWFAITEPMKLTVTIEAPERVGCFGYHDGYAHSLPSGGVEPYKFQWVAKDSIISYEKNLDSIPQSEYILKVTDANGCTVVGKIRILGRPKLTIIIDPRTGKWRVPDKAGPVKVVSYNDALRGYELTISDDNGCTCSDTFSRPIKLPKGTSPPVWYKLHQFLRKIFPSLNRRKVKCYYFTSILTLRTPLILTA